MIIEYIVFAIRRFNDWYITIIYLIIIVYVYIIKLASDLKVEESALKKRKRILFVCVQMQVRERIFTAHFQK